MQEVGLAIEKSEDATFASNLFGVNLAPPTRQYNAQSTVAALNLLRRGTSENIDTAPWAKVENSRRTT